MLEAQLLLDELIDAQRLLDKRRFAEAMEFALKGLERSKSYRDTKQTLQSLRLLADITNTQGRYQNDGAQHAKAFSYLQEATRVADAAGLKDALWDTQVQLIHTNLLQNEYDEAFELLCACMSDQNILDEDANKKIIILLAYSEYHYTKNEYDEAANFVSLALREITGEESSVLLLDLYDQAVRVYLRKQDYPNIYTYGTKVLRLATSVGDVEREFIGLNAIAIHHASKQDFKKAMFNFRNALDKSTEIEYRYGIAFSLINIATIYANLFNYDEALSRYHKVLDEYGDILDDNNHLIILNNIGNIYYVIGDFEEALDCFRHSIELAKNMGYAEMEAHVLAQSSRALVALHRYNEALEAAQTSMQLIKETGAREGQHIIYITLGNIYYELGDYSQAMNYVGRGIVSSKQMQDATSEIRGYRLMSNIFKEKGDFKKALDYQIFYSQAQERYALNQMNRQMVDLEIQYDFQQKEKEYEILKTYQDKLVAQHTRITEQNEKLVEANQNLTQFAYAVSHDLKEPLRMIGSYTKLLTEKHGGELGEVSNEYFNYISLGVGQMGRLLDDLLKYATIGNEDGLDIEKVDLAEIFELTTLNLQVAIEESHAIVESNDLPKILTNRSYISQLFQNLIGNAVKFKKVGRDPVVQVHYALVKGKHHISVKDNGIGIPAESVDRIFQAFQRLHKKEGYKGTGIGLAICIKIVKRLGGEIHVESKEGEGSTFTLILPVENPYENKEEANRETV